MCAQCNNKKLHIHTVKPAVASACSVTVEAGLAPACCNSAVDSQIHAAESESGGDGGGDDEPGAGTAACCSAGNCQAAGPAVDERPAEVGVNPSASRKTLSWKIENMDCPSCAGKLEKAIFSLAGIETAKVMFATQKLVVSCRSEAMAAAIEQKAKQTGFPLVSIRSKSSETEEKSLLRQNLHLIFIAALMLLSFLMSRISPAYGMAAFTLTTLSGLAPIVKKAISLARSGTLFSIETLMTVAATGALYLGETAEAAMVLLLFLIGQQLEGYASARARSGVKALMALVPELATVIRPDGGKVKVAAEELKLGDIIEVAPGGRLPADAELLNTIASFDESALTGESVPIERQPGEQIMAGSLVSDKVVRLEIVSEQGDNAIDRILHLIEQAELRKAPLERFMDRFSRWYTPAMIVLAALVVVMPPVFFAQPWEAWLYKGLTLLLIACPCALVISIPAAITSGLAAAARRGALIKGGATLEQLGSIETIAFDKTGTLTEGKPRVTDIISWDGDDDRLLRQAAAVEAGSLHPLAMAVVQAAQKRGWPVAEAEEREALPGRGIRGNVDGDTLLLAAADRLPESARLSQGQQSEVARLESEGKTLVVAFRNGQPVGMIAWRDNLREDSHRAIRQLKAMGIHAVMLTGDNHRAAAAIAREIEIDFRAGLLPADKVAEVEQANQRAKVAMVGDGINDAPAMKTAFVGIAMGGGADVALETADAALTHNRVSELPVMIALSRATLANIRQNIVLALGLKGVFLVTTLLGMTGLWVAVLADSGGNGTGDAQCPETVKVQAGY